MKRMDMKNAVKIDNCPALDVEGMNTPQEVMRLNMGAKKILYLGGYDYSIDEIVSITACAGIIAIDEGKGVPPGVTDKELINDTAEIQHVAKELREAGDQEYIDMIADAKEYVEQFYHDMNESIKTLERNGLLPGLLTMKPPSTMYR